MVLIVLTHLCIHLLGNFSLNVLREAPDVHNITLFGLRLYPNRVEPLTFSPPFIPGKMAYSTIVPYVMNHVNLTTIYLTSSTVKIDRGVNVDEVNGFASGDMQGIFPLAVGPNLILVVSTRDGQCTPTPATFAV